MVIPYDATRFRIATIWSGTTGSNGRGVFGSTYFQMGNTNNALTFDFTAPMEQFADGGAKGVIKIDPPVFETYRLTSGTTFNVPAGAKWLRVRMAGGGGGGAGAAPSVPNQGVNGGATTFGPHTASGGGQGSLNSGIGGTCTLGAGGRHARVIMGNSGQATSVIGGGSGGIGGAHPLFGGSPQAVWANNPTVITPNTGSGGGGGGVAASNVYPGGGGGSGGACDIIIDSPASSYTYSLGSGGSPGSGGTNGYTGGAGSSGVIEVDVYFTSWESMLASGALSRVSGAVMGSTTVSNGGGSGLTTVESGTYSAVITGGTNAAVVTSPQTCNYLRIGKTVHVSCITSNGCTTASGTLTNLTMTVPVTPTTNALGTVGSSLGESGRVLGNDSTTVLVQHTCNNTSSAGRPVVFSYQIP